MVRQVEHEDEGIRIEVYPGQRLLRSTWKDAVSSQGYRGSLLRVHSIVERLALQHWLSDGRKMGPILPDDEAWTMEEFLPKLIGAGLERIAIVSSEDALNRTAVDRMVNASAPVVPYTIAYFQDPSIAQLWLMDKASATTVPRG